MAYAIMRCQKMKKNDLAKYDNHHWRQRDKLKERKHAERESENITKLKDDKTLYENVKELIKEQEERTKKKVRKDCVCAIEFVFAFSPEAENTFCIEEWAKENLLWLKNEVCDNILEYNIEYDETTPHMHAVIAPIDEKGNFNAKKICGNKFEKWQDIYGIYMSVFGLERGIPKKITKREHTTLKEYNNQLKKENDILNEEKRKNEKRVNELIQERKNLADEILNGEGEKKKENERY